MKLLVLITLLLPFCGIADEFVKPFVTKYCLDCHNNKKQKGKVNLESIQMDLQKGDHELWTHVYDQMVFGEMPPDDEEQPGNKERQKITAWIEKELSKVGKKPENILLEPGKGNYVDHDSLFGSEGFGPSYSLERIWRIRPDVITSRLGKIARRVSLLQPFNMRAGGHGFLDYDNQYRLTSPDLNQMMSNANKIAIALTSVKKSKGRIGKLLILSLRRFIPKYRILMKLF